MEQPGEQGPNPDSARAIDGDRRDVVIGERRVRGVVGDEESAA